MLKIKNDFFSKFKKASDSNSADQKKAILNEQIISAILNDREEVLGALDAGGVTLPPNAHNREIINAIVKHAGKNETIQNGLAYVILTNTGTIAESNADAGAEGALGGLKGAMGGAGAGPIGAIIGAVGGAVGAIFSSKAATTNAKAMDDAQRNALVLELIKQDGKGSNAGLWIGVSVAAVAIGLFVYLKVKK